MDKGAGSGNSIYEIGKKCGSAPYFYQMKTRKIIVVLMITLVLPRFCLAWGMQGHRVVGGIAEKYLSAKARAEIKKLLGNESLAMAANWADFIKSDRSYDYLSNWHYINLEEGMSQAQLFAKLNSDTSTNLYTKMQWLSRELKSGTLSREKKIFYLKLLIHFVGDAHQPMHTARPADRGGNDIRVFWFNNPTNLHRVWDEHLVEYQQLSYTEHVAAINFATAAQVKLWQNQPVKQWIFDSYEIAGRLYADIKPDSKLGYQYNFKHVDTMNRQLLKGGIRLAGLLNQIFAAG